MNLFQILVSIAIMLDGMLASMPKVTVEPTKENLYFHADQITTAFVDGLNYKELFPSITFENLNGAKGASDAPEWQFNPYCGRDIALGMQYRYPNYRFHDTIDIIPTLVHEMSHMYQGVECSSKTVETSATLIGLEALSKMPEDSVYYQALLWQLRELAIFKALDEKCDKSWMEDLSAEAQSLYKDTSCSYAKSRHFYTDALTLILENKANGMESIAELLNNP